MGRKCLLLKRNASDWHSVRKRHIVSMRNSLSERINYLFMVRKSEEEGRGRFIHTGNGTAHEIVALRRTVKYFPGMFIQNYRYLTE